MNNVATMSCLPLPLPKDKSLAAISSPLGQ
jgi:hypothetical protein